MLYREPNAALMPRKGDHYLQDANSLRGPMLYRYESNKDASGWVFVASGDVAVQIARAMDHSDQPNTYGAF